MVSFWVIQDVTGHGIWNSSYRAFRGWLFADRFDTKQQAVDKAIEDNVGFCRVTEMMDTKVEKKSTFLNRCVSGGICEHGAFSLTAHPCVKECKLK